MRKLLPCLFALLFLVLAIQLAHASSIHEFHAVITESGYQDPDNFFYVVLAENASHGEVNITVNMETYQCYITSINLSQVEIDVKGVLAKYNIDSVWALMFIGKLTIQIDVQGTDSMTVKLHGCPTVLNINKNGKPFTNWTYQNNTLSLTLTSGDPTFDVYFTSITDLIIESFSAIITILAIVLVLKLLYEYVSK